MDVGSKALERSAPSADRRARDWDDRETAKTERQIDEVSSHGPTMAYTTIFRLWIYLEPYTQQAEDTYVQNIISHQMQQLTNTKTPVGWERIMSPNYVQRSVTYFLP